MASQTTTSRGTSRNMLSILIIPAASALPSIYTKVVSEVAAHGYDIKALHIPSVGVGLPSGPRLGDPPSMYDDAAFIASHIAELADAGRDVLLVTHSYGGTPATESVQGLSKIERTKKGLQGGVVGLAYMTSLVPEVGKPASTKSLSPLMETDVCCLNPTLDFLITNADQEDGWFYYPDNKLVANIVFSDLPQEQGEALATQLVPHSEASFRSPLTYAGYKDVPVWYLVAEGDKSISPETQRSQISMIEQTSENKVDFAVTGAGHVPPVTAPKDVSDWILAVVSKLGEGQAETT